ncbi:hypothetical protein TIFTF001_054695 [Ficus carica]|uniref:Uncharacterized protein n=1 Tax=Ficus carica TaxID=3494 RepID=A0AA88EGL3_FICCA|nr:hypothetical protein TIFTF001_054565 [Ficus carica]GMN71041.1 hypothetical protein TIFTF001_054566 [Ficus carica]GMN71047.1 hypothetical protein TIFTF001_054567 [Ficus carica]GMN71051.1 hypothetical protein TIFTF001_054568 [Ficus carica]GMN72209.1 hypothetical protein TIFTF001_054695 [Ficus carica]
MLAPGARVQPLFRIAGQIFAWQWFVIVTVAAFAPACMQQRRNF